MCTAAVSDKGVPGVYPRDWADCFEVQEEHQELGLGGPTRRIKGNFGPT